MRTSKSYKNIDLPSLNEEQLKEIEALKTMSDDQIDTSDIPEASSKMLASGHLYYAASLKMPKTAVHIMIDNDNQPRLNKVLRWARLNNCPIEDM